MDASKKKTSGMKIGIDARLYNESGIGRYIRNLLNLLQILDIKNQYFIFLLESDYKNLKFNPNFHKVLANFKWYGISEQIKFPKILNQQNLDIVHFPHFNVPIFYKGKFIVTIHDLIHQKFAMKKATALNPIAYKLKQIGYKKVFQNGIKKSEKILVPSNYVKKELIKDWSVNDYKITVTYEGVDEILLNINSEMTSDDVLESLRQLKIAQPYIFYVGNAHPHKNVDGLIKAFLSLRKRHQSLKLVLSGGDHYFWQKVIKEFKKDQIDSSNDIIFTGFVSDKQLVALYKGAKCFVMPSFEEGFGIPLLEAMSVGCPVVSSNAASLPEIADDAALYFDPRNIEDIAVKISKVLDNEKTRKNLIERGKNRYRKFSWKKLAGETLKIYNSV